MAVTAMDLEVVIKAVSEATTRLATEVRDPILHFLVAAIAILPRTTSY
jgi:hypothetical protein